ncbi:MAG: hypothetical protein HY710_03840 [Candidatus Latescibacteria bacterium]|nr:hypothetical protein [Candidatus Latescibacterota bacterium]
MEFKPDWPQAVERFQAWWAGDIIDRVALQVTAPKAGYQPRPVPPPPTLEARWTSVDYVIEAAEERMRATFYGGEAFPIFFPSLGPDVFSAYLGCESIFAPDTIWVKPNITDWDNPPPLTLDPSNRWWRLTLEMIERALERAPGRYFVGLTDLHGGMDALSAMRGREQLCVDLIDCPEKIKVAMEDFITPLWFDIYEAMHQPIQEKMTGSTSWFPVWSPGRWYPTSCDFAALVSPAMFDDFILPDIVAEVEWLDHSLYHLDGPDAIVHLDSLLNIPRLGGIQWVPGARYSSMLPWLPLLKRIQRAGKLLHLSVNPYEIEPLLRELSPNGVMFHTSCPTEAEARALLSTAERWTRSG